MGLLRDILNLHLVLGTLSKATPLLLAALGGVWSERAGVINFALEGMMLTGAFAAVWGSYVTGSPWVGVGCAVVAGLALAAVHGLASLHLRVNQIVSAMALNILALGATGSLMECVFGTVGTSPSVAKLPSLPLAEGRVGVLSIVAVVAAIGSGLLLYRTRWGLAVRAVGEDPTAALTVGARVFRLKWACVLASGVLAGLAGAHISTGDLSQFLEGMTGGRGYIAVAAVIFGRWRPGGVMLACFLFGLADALGENLQGVGIARWHISPEWALMVPFLVTVAALAGLVGRSVAPRGLGETPSGEG